LQQSSDIEFWATHQAALPHLSKLAFRYLAIQPTQVPSERIFSRAKFVVEKRKSVDVAGLEYVVVSSMNVKRLAAKYPGFRGVPVSDALEEDAVEPAVEVMDLTE